MKNYKIAIGEQLTVKKWESGTNNISAADLIKYLQILEVDIEQFIRKVQ